MGKRISVGELRQNPTKMLREVKRGSKYTVTDHGEPIAEVVALERPHWIAASDVDALLRELGADGNWAQVIEAARGAEPADDPWEGQG